MAYDDVKDFVVESREKKLTHAASKNLAKPVAVKRCDTMICENIPDTI